MRFILDSEIEGHGLAFFSCLISLKGSFFSSEAFFPLKVDLFSVPSS